MTSIEDRLVELINSASAEVDGTKKVEYWCQMKDLASNHGLLNNFFQDILTPTLVICFNLEGTRLICGGGPNLDTVELWTIDSTNHWYLSWTCELASPINFLRYSPDSTLFCSANRSDKLVKVWYETRTNSYSFTYLKHPEPITSLEWRRTGRFTPRGAVANVLMTSCQDNRVRLWVQTSLPDLVNFKLMPHFHLAAIIEDNSTTALVTHWINNKEMHMTRSLETLLQDMLARILKDNEQVSTSTTPTTNDLDLEVDANDDTLTAESSKKLRHKLCRKINKQRALAASGRSSATSKEQQRSNNNISSGLTTNSDADSGVNNNGPANGQNATNGGGGSTSLADEFDKTLESLLKDWRGSTDLLFSINKADGTITSWQVKHLDGEESGALRQVQVEIYSCLKSALPSHDATTMSNITAFSPNVATEKPIIFIVTQHVSGTLGLWKLNLEHGIEPVTRITGLPISPEWLRDGVLTVEYDNDAGHLITDWIQDCAKIQSTIEEHEPFMDQKDYYKASQLATKLKLLPQYHLTQLVELLAFGKLQRVKAILNHLVNCLAPSDKNHRKKQAHRSRTFSIANQSAPSFQESLDLDDPSSPLQQTSVEEVELDYVEVTSIKPLTLHLLLEADVERPNSNDGKLHHAHEEFSTSFDTFTFSKSTVDETLDEILGKSTLETLNKQKELKRLASEEGEGSLTSFNPRKAKLLTHILTHTLLPGLTNIDQMHLLAVADAVAFFDASPNDLSDLYDEDSNDGSHERGAGLSMVSTNIAIDSLDDRGLRFLTAMRQYVYLTKCLPMKQRNELRSTGIGTDHIVWAFHSETQDELIGLIPCLQRNKPEWAELREFGIGWWVKKLEVLRRIIEKVAQSAYQAKQDPLDAALFYLAMKKKTLVCALLRRTNCDKRLLKLFEQDFNDPVNRKKALKNAYALLGLHRFEHAAAFFLLAGSIWDAVEVCINNLHDIQLAMVLIRLNDSDSNVPDNLKRLLFTEILGSKAPNEQQTGALPSPPTKSESGTFSSSASSTTSALSRRKSSIAQGYSYDIKRAHQDPFLRSMAFWKLGDYLSSVHTLLEGDVNDLNVNASIFNFYRFLKEQPLVVKHKNQLMEELELKKRTSPIEEDQFHFNRARSLSSGELGFDGIKRSITLKQSSTEFEVLNETTHLVNKYSDEAVAENERKLFFSTALSYLESGFPLLAIEVLCSEDHLNSSQANRMKFISCLHILLNELNTLAQNHADTNGSSKIGGSSSGVVGAQVDTLSSSQSNVVDGDANGGHYDEDKTFTKVFQEWFDSNIDACKSICSFSGSQESILRTMLTYCSLHFAHEESLNLVRSAILERLSAA
jgi:hypothetical protein